MTEREQLLKEADELGLKFAKNITTDKLRNGVEQAKELNVAEEAIEDAGGVPVKDPKPPTEDEIRSQLEIEFKEKLETEKRKLTANMELNMARVSEGAATNKVTVGQAKLKARRDALKLVRVNVTTRDPLKTSWEGEIFTVSNDVIGDVKKYVMFNTDNGYHVQQIIVNMLKNKKCTIFKRKKGRDGKYVNEGHQVSAFNIEVLPPLTQEELDELAREQSGASEKN